MGPSFATFKVADVARPAFHKLYKGSYQGAVLSIVLLHLASFRFLLFPVPVEQAR